MSVQVIYREDDELWFVNEFGEATDLNSLEGEDFKLAQSIDLSAIGEGEAYLVQPTDYDFVQSEDEATGEASAPGDSGEDDSGEVAEESDEPGVESGDVDNGGQASQADGDADGDAEQADGQADGQADDEGDGEGEGDQEGDQEGDADGGTDEQEQDMEQAIEQGAPEYDDSDDPEPPEDNPFAQEMWDDWLREMVVAIAEGRSTQAYEAAVRAAVALSGTGGMPNGPVHVSEDPEVFDEFVPTDIPKNKSGEVRHFQYERIFRAVKAGDVYIPGPPGTGKSHVAEQIANDMGLKFSLLSCSPLDTPAKWFGYMDANGNPRLETLYYAMTEGHLMCIDEMDNSNPSMITAINSLVANRMYSFPGVGLTEAHPDFRLVATANTFGTGPTAEFAGRCRLDPATLDRFAIVPMGVDEGIETQLVERIVGAEMAARWLRQVRHARKAVEALRIKTFVTMRGAIAGAELIKQGFSIGDAYDMRIVGTLNEDVRQKIAAWS